MGSLDHPFNPLSLVLGAEATFVARTIDSDRQHLTGVLRAAAAHKGTSFVEIYQNCNIFNDGAFDVLKSPETRDEVVIRLEDGAPIRFGPEGAKGLRWVAGHLEVVAAGSVPSDERVVHDARADEPSLAFALSRLDSTDFAHTPIGIFRDVDRPTYDDMMATQVAEAQASQDKAELGALLRSTDTWTIEA